MSLLSVGLASPVGAATGLPVFTTEPADVVVTVGSTVSISASAEAPGDPSSMEMTFEKSTDGGQTWNAEAGCGDSSTTILNCGTSFTAQLADSGTLFRAVVVNAAGTVTSRSATVTVCDETSCLVSTFSVSPDSDLVDGQEVTVTASGLAPNMSADVATCTGDPARCTPATTSMTDDDGNLSTPLIVSRFPPSRDCFVDACYVRVRISGADFVVAPISFRQPIVVLPMVGSVVEGDAGTVAVEVPVTLSAPSSDEVTVQWEIIALPQIDPALVATPGVDFIDDGTGVVTFASNDTDEVVSITVNGDTDVEEDELIVLRFHSATNALIGGFYGLGVGVILDDDVPPPPEITLTPATSLRGGDVVTVTGDNWPPDSTVGMCQADAQTATPPEDACRSGTGGAVSVPVDGAGRFSADYTLTRFAFIPARGDFIDCTDPATPCLMGVAEIDQNQQPFGPAATAPLPFADPPPPPGTLGQITVDPPSGITDGDTLTVTGTGFRADAVIELYPCVATAAPPGGCDYAKRVNTVADGSGSFAQTMPAHQFLYGTGVDCALDACVVGAGEAVDFPGTFVTAPVAFAPPVPSVRPMVGSVVEGDAGSVVVEVPVTLSEPTSAEVTVQWEIIALPLIDPALVPTPGVDFVDATGTVTFAPDDIDEVVSIDVLGDELDELDELIVVRFHSPTNAVLNGFYGLGVGVIEDDDEPPPPSITVTPNTELDGGDIVTVTGTNFTPSSTVGMCQADAVPYDPLIDGCRSGTGGAVSASVDANGEFSIDYRVLRWAFIPGRGAFIDCTDPATPCVIGVAEIDQNQEPVGPTVTESLSFATPPPPPGTRGTITVTPSVDVMDGETLTVTGTGFRADANIELYPCLDPVSTPMNCAWGFRVDIAADSAGAFQTTMTAQQFIFGTQNCATRPCVITASEAVDFIGTFTTTPIAFAPPPP
ncbi:MAG: neocarzinostatin apoprotein domain-containing protein [Acidimicrobiia bacterium]|nr:neocarzinostatin apoprotein domain-containing protein [Acidimicrobiia bacterium]